MEQTSNKRIALKTTVYNKPIGYCTPVKNHNVGRQEAKSIRKNFVVK
jgi:hypothetical protein